MKELQKILTLLEKIEDKILNDHYEDCLYEMNQAKVMLREYINSH